MKSCGRPWSGTSAEGAVLEALLRPRERFAAEDPKKKEEVKTIHRADRLIYTTERRLRDQGALKTKEKCFHEARNEWAKKHELLAKDL